MKIYSSSKTLFRMSRDKFIANIVQLKQDLNQTEKSIRELKSLYFSLNLDYIRQCESGMGQCYFPSRDCDSEMRLCNSDNEKETATRIIRRRIDQVLNSMR